MKVRAVSPANIAFIKFWGKADPKLNIPFNDSFSMNLSGCLTTTGVEFDGGLKEDEVVINGESAAGERKQRVVEFLDLVRKKAGITTRAMVESENNFPEAAGIASSASAFSALAMAGSRAAGLQLPTGELTRLARRGSGSACRSVVDGFGYWRKGNSDETSFAVQMADEKYWDLVDIVTVVAEERKKASSTEGHAAAESSPYFKTRLANLPHRITEMKKAFKEKEFGRFGELVEEEAVDLHMMAMTSRPPIWYWNAGTVQVINNLREWRSDGLLGFATMDAGASVHVICEKKDVEKLNRKLQELPSVKFTIINVAGKGTHEV